MGERGERIGIAYLSLCYKYAIANLIHQENAGVSAARNAGIDAATAPLLSFIDPDDLISENYFSCLVGDLLAENADCAVSTFQYVLENGKEGAYERVNFSQRRRGHSSISVQARTMTWGVWPLERLTAATW
ncbi:MAG: glycosyltransferase [Oscillospiraceae bacterium]|nr:glycosyltransferase [Oscillospiraceae bacterium]